MFDHKFEKFDILSNSEYNDPISNRGSGNFKHHLESGSSSNRNILVDNSPERRETPKDQARAQIKNLSNLVDSISKEQTPTRNPKENLKINVHPPKIPRTQSGTYETPHQVKFKLAVEINDDDIEDEEEELNDQIMNNTVNFVSSKNQRRARLSLIESSGARLNQTVMSGKPELKMSKVFMARGRQSLNPKRISINSIFAEDEEEKCEDVITLSIKNSKFKLKYKNGDNFDWPSGINLELFLNDTSVKKKSKTSKQPRIFFGSCEIGEKLKEGESREFDFDFQNVFEDEKMLKMLKESKKVKARFYGAIDRRKYFSAYDDIYIEIKDENL